MYPNILTPPSSSEESPQAYNTMPSPQYYIIQPTADSYSAPYLITSGEQQYGMSPTATVIDRKGAYLTISEQPTDKFRFRYKSEMAGTHGSLTGLNSDKTRKQTYPTVKLHNHYGPAVVRCSLYQYGLSEEKRQPHAHRLIKKHGSEEIDDPHSINVSEHDGYDACFHSMGIIHTAKKHIVDELKRKKALLKKEEVARIERKIRHLSKKEEVEISALAEEESKSINLNIVCLRFDAFRMTPEGILEPLCPPVYSHAINNLKSALTGELKIVRMDHSSSPSKGNREIFMLVEKVTKKNIKVRFYELDDEDNEVWSDYGKFSDLDVHHQYAIVFRTPAYKQVDIEHQKIVYIELQRPSDGSRSEPREFTYYPVQTPGAKRARSSDYSSGSGSYSLSSGDLPVPLLNMPTLNFDNSIPPVNSSDLENALKNVGSEEFEKIFFDYYRPEMEVQSSFVLDAPGSAMKASKNCDMRQMFVDPYVITDKDDEIMKRVYSELKALIKTNPPKKTVIGMLEHLFQKYVNDMRNNALHLAIMAGDSDLYMYLFKTIAYLKQFQLLNNKNANNETILHIAVGMENLRIVELILKYKPDLSVRDGSGNTVLHRAIIASCSKDLLATVLNCGAVLNLDVDARNHDDHTALHMAVKMNNLAYVELLCKHSANVNDPEKKAGRSVLHIAVTEQSKEIVSFLLQNTNIEVQMKDFAGSTALQLAFVMKNEPIYNMIANNLKSNGVFSNCVIKEEEDSDEEMECDEVECKTERLTPEELTKLYENVKTLTPECLDQVSEILDESGQWESLADLLDLEHLLHTDWFSKATSPSKALLNSAVTFGDVLLIRNFLENLEEMKAVSIIDNMVMSKK